MFPPFFNDCVLTKNKSIWNFVESAFYLEGISGYQKYRVERIDHKSHYLSRLPTAAFGAKQMLLTVLKITFLIPLFLPLILLKVYYRNSRQFLIGSGFPYLGKMASHLARHFASIKVDPDSILKDALAFFKGTKNQLVGANPLLKDFLQRHAVYGRVKVHPQLTLEEMVKEVAKVRPDGIDPREGQQAMQELVESLLEASPYSDPNSEGRRLLKLFRERLKELQKKDQRSVEEILSAAYQRAFQEVGSFFDAGWRRSTGGHYIHVELRLVEHGWQFILCNAGLGSNRHHRHAFVRDRHGDPIRSDETKIVPVKVYEVQTENAAEALLQSLLLYRTSGSDKPANGKEEEGFYQLFKHAKAIEHHNIPYRYGQLMGNCALRSLLEGLFYICQRKGEVALANDFQKMVEAKVLQNVHPLLKAKILERGPKPAIQPFHPSDQKLHLLDPKANVEHILPFNTSYPIGRSAEIRLPDDPNLYSSEQGHLSLENDKIYLTVHPKSNYEVAVLRQGKVIPTLHKMEVQLGDRLRFSRQYELEV